MRVLIAEDDEKLLKSLIYILKKCHIEADGVTNGQDAFDAALSGMYDGWIFDIMMPKLDGIELLKRLRGREIRTPALFLTAKTEIEDRVEGLDAGALFVQTICSGRVSGQSSGNASQKRAVRSRYTKSR